MHYDSRMDGMGCSKIKLKKVSSLVDELLSIYCSRGENSFALNQKPFLFGALGSHFVQHTPAGQLMLLEQSVGYCIHLFRDLLLMSLSYQTSDM